MADDDGDKQVEEDADLSGDLFQEPPPFAGGSAIHPVGDLIPPTEGPAEVDVPVPDADVGPDGLEGPPAEPIDITAEDDDDADPGFLEQVADAVGDLWDDARDAVT